MQIAENLTEREFLPIIDLFIPIARHKIQFFFRRWVGQPNAPVFTYAGRYQPRGWTEWTRGFLFGIPILFYELTKETPFIEMVRGELSRLFSYLTHTGVHDHGFNTVSSFGNMWRLVRTGQYTCSEDELRLYELAIRVSGAVQASRWTTLEDGTGFIHSFNGPHSLFVDTIRTCRVLELAWLLGQELKSEGDVTVSLMDRAIQHIHNTLRFNVYYGRGRDAFDVRGRVAHECIFNTRTGQFRCPSTQQGYSPFSTWMRGLAWAMLGCAEQLEFFQSLPVEYRTYIQREHGVDIVKELVTAGKATAEFYIEHTTVDGIPFWDTGAPGLSYLGKYQSLPADPYNDIEPLDSSAAVISAQALLRLSDCLPEDDRDKERYRQAGLTVVKTLLISKFVSVETEHEGLLLHAVYHRPNGWDYIPRGRNIPCGESCIWGDYHLLELLVWLTQKARGERPWNFYANVEPSRELLAHVVSDRKG